MDSHSERRIMDMAMAGMSAGSWMFTAAYVQQAYYLFILDTREHSVECQQWRLRLLVLRFSNAFL